MKVSNALAGSITGVDNHSIPALGYVQLVRDFRGAIFAQQLRFWKALRWLA